jgi:hypothetical protein
VAPPSALRNNNRAALAIAVEIVKEVLAMAA